MRFNICFWKMTRPLQSYDRQQIIIEIVNRIVLHLMCLLQPKTCDHSTNESFQKAYLNPLIGHYYIPMYPEKPSSNQISLSHNTHSCSPHDPDPLERLVRVQCYVKAKYRPTRCMFTFARRYEFCFIFTLTDKQNFRQIQGVRARVEEMVQLSLSLQCRYFSQLVRLARRCFG